MNPIRVLLLALLLLALYACRPQPDRAADRPAPQLLLTAEPAWFETPHDFDPKTGVGKIHQGGLNGLLDRHGKVMAPAKYRYLIHRPVDDYWHGEYQSTDAFSFVRALIEDARWGLLLSDGTEVVPPVYNTPPRMLGEGLFAVPRGGKWHFFNLQGKEAFKASFDSVDHFHSGLAAVADGCDPGYGDMGCFNGKWGFLDVTGRLRVPLEFDAVKDFVNGVAWVNRGCVNEQDCEDINCRGGRWGLIDSQGKLVLPFDYVDYNDLMQSGKIRKNEQHRDVRLWEIVVQSEGKTKEGEPKRLFGVVDATGKILLPPRNGNVSREYDYLVVSADEKTWEIRDLTGKLLLAGLASRDVAATWVDKKMGEFVPGAVAPDEDDSRRDPYDWVATCDEEKVSDVAAPTGGRCLAFVHKDNLVYCREAGDHMFPLPGVTRVTAFNGPWAPFEKGGRWGLLDRDGQIVYAAELDFSMLAPTVCGFNLERDAAGNALFFYREKPRWAVIGADGVRAPWRASPLPESLVWDKWVETLTGEARDFPLPVVATAVPAKWSVEKVSGGFVVKAEAGPTVIAGPYEKVKPVRDGEFFIVGNSCDQEEEKSCSKTGLIDHAGKVIVPLEYNWIWPESKAAEDDDCRVGSDFVRGLIRVDKNQFTGVYDTKLGREIIAPRRYSAICAFEGKVARVRVNKGREFDPETVDWVSMGLWGLVSDTDQELVPPVHGALEPFSGGVARFRVHAPCTTRGHAPCAHGRVGLLDTAGRVVLAPEYDAISPKLADGTRRVLQTGRMGLLRVRRR